MISILEQLEAMNRHVKSTPTCAQVHECRMAYILKVLHTPRSMPELAKLLAVTQHTMRQYLGLLLKEDKIVYNESIYKWCLKEDKR